MNDLSFQRLNMIKLQLEHRKIATNDVLLAFSSIDKENYLSNELKPFAYADCEFREKNGLFIPRPAILAQAISLLEDIGGLRILTVGCCAYTIAVLSFLKAHIIALYEEASSIESISQIFIDADVNCVRGSLINGYPAGAKFDRILIQTHFAGAEWLVRQLANDGILVSISHDKIITLTKNEFYFKKTIATFKKPTKTINYENYTSHIFFEN